MALTEFQRTVCRLIASERIRSGVSYVASGVALNTLTNSPLVSRDIFHDAHDSVEASCVADRNSLEKAGYTIRALRERETFVEASRSIIFRRPAGCRDAVADLARYA